MSQGEQGTQEHDRTVAGRYRLLSVVGSGGMGTVWRARDEALHREVAIKEVVLHHSLDDREREERHQRTLREARASARLNHPGVVTVHDVVDEDGRPWIVMELVRSRSLQEIVDQDGPLPPVRVAAIGRQVVGALRAAHAIGILHRDVKPANVLITDDERAVLTDFGIAQIAGDATLTGTGLLVGSPAYMSPERVNGERAIPASDLWALGATLYAASEGRSPFHRSDAMAVLAAVMTQDPPVPRNAGPLAPVLAGLLERDPVRRMGADEAEAALTRIAAGGTAATTTMDARWGEQTATSPAPPPSTSDIPVPWAPPPATGPIEPKRPRRMLWPLLAALLGAVAVGLVVVLLLNQGGGGGKGSVAGTRSPAPPSGSPASATPSAAQPSQSPSPATPPSLPAGMRWVGDGYRIAVPATWKPRRQSADRMFWEDPASRAYVMVDRTPWTGDPVAHWKQWEREVKAKNELPGYQRLGLTHASVQGTPAADLEYYWSGARMHVMDRGVRMPGGTFAIAVSVPEPLWNERRGTVKNVLDSFHQ